MKLLVLGDFSRGKTKGRVLNRERINVNKSNLNQVLANFSPELNFIVQDKLNKNNNDLQVKLKISDFSDFNPQAIAYQIPQLKKLIAMRNLLKELKSNILDDLTLRQKLEAIINNEQDKQALQQELARIAPIDDMTALTGEQA